MHATTGFLILIITCFFGYEAWRKIGGFKILNKPHVYVAFACTFGIFFIVALGMVARYAKVNWKWSTRNAITLTYMHKSFSYMLIFTGFIAIITGLYDYRNKPRDWVKIHWEYVFIGAILLTFIPMELIFRHINKKEDYFKINGKYETTNQIMTLD